jgi:hypothetical protein
MSCSRSSSERRSSAGSIEWLIGVFAAQSPGARDDVLLIDQPEVSLSSSGTASAPEASLDCLRATSLWEVSLA